MPKEPLKILAINPGSRYLGMALFSGPDLRDWGIKVIKGRWSQGKLERILAIVSGLIEDYLPNVLAIKRLHPSRSSKNLDLLIRKLRQLARRKKLKIFQYSIKDLEAFFLPNEKRQNKKRLAEIIASCHPELYFELEKEKRNQNSYYLKMFEAVALGSACFHKLDK